ncbi:hypothetical protein D3C78_1933970 [compost metagenome]
MPYWRNMPSIPKVRDSSGTIGTICLPMFLSLSRMPSWRTKAMVVENSRSPESLNWLSNTCRPGMASGVFTGLRAGR